MTKISTEKDKFLLAVDELFNMYLQELKNFISEGISLQSLKNMKDYRQQITGLFKLFDLLHHYQFYNDEEFSELSKALYRLTEHLDKNCLCIEKMKLGNR